MKDYKLSADEAQEIKDIETAFERGEFVDVAEDFEARKRELQQIARNTSRKTKTINIRLTENDLRRLKVKALEEGLPYQTLAASILHKATSR